MGRTFREKTMVGLAGRISEQVYQTAKNYPE